MAYTNRSFWQVYNSEQSAPFRDTNHEPEFWTQFRPDWKILGLTNSVNQLGINHQSNGRGGVLSRSWDRVFANFVFERDNFALSIKPWYRIEEDEADDNNPDIEDFLGHGEIRRPTNGIGTRSASCSEMHSSPILISPRSS